jgi:hypothetical protein
MCNVHFFLKTPLYGAGEFDLNSPTPTLFPLKSLSGVNMDEQQV